MRKLIALMLAVTMLLCGAAFAKSTVNDAQSEPEPMLIYSPYMPRPMAVLLPGVAVDTMDTNDEWTGVFYPADEYAGDTGRIRTGSYICKTMDSNAWPEAELIRDAEVNSIDLNVCFGTLSKGTKVKVAGLCNGAWYVLVDDGEATRFGSIYLDDLLVDDETAALLHRYLPDFYATAEEIDAAYADWEVRIAQLNALYSEDENNWPQDVRAEFDEFQWKLGFYWQNAYAVQPAEGELTMQQAIDAVRYEVTERLHIPMDDAAELRAQYLLRSGYDKPEWHVWWRLMEGEQEFMVYGTPDAAVQDLTVVTDAAQLYHSRDCLEWPIAAHTALALCAGYGDEGDDQPIAEGMMDEATARSIVWQCAAENLDGVTPETCVMQLLFYDRGTVMDYTWEREAWCDDRPVFRANFYTLDELLGVGELWLDAETGEVYRVSAESSGMG